MQDWCRQDVQSSVDGVVQEGCKPGVRSNHGARQEWCKLEVQSNDDVQGQEWCQLELQSSGGCTVWTLKCNLNLETVKGRDLRELDSELLERRTPCSEPSCCTHGCSEHAARQAVTAR